jgi:hypothetical protein
MPLPASPVAGGYTFETPRITLSFATAENSREALFCKNLQGIVSGL